MVDESEKMVEESSYADDEEDILDWDGEEAWERAFEKGERNANEDLIDEWNNSDY